MLMEQNHAQCLSGRKDDDSSLKCTYAESLSLIECLSILHSSKKLEQSIFLNLLNQVVLERDSLQSIATLFFENESWSGNRLNNGVVETPEKTADLIVALAITTLINADDNDLEYIREYSWFDPCVGAGAFPLAVIKKYISMFGGRTINDLPRISFNDVSASAVFLSLCSIKIKLQAVGLSLDEYILSGRLMFECGDILAKHLESKDLLNIQPTYDVVIANPPYVRSTRLSASYRKFLKENFSESFHGSADLYSYFIVSGISCLKQNGVMAFISPAGFLRSASCQNLRNFILKNATFKSLVDLGETRIFNNASVHAAIYTLSKSQSKNDTIRYSEINSSPELEKLCLDPSSMPEAIADIACNRGWSFHSNNQNFYKLDRIMNSSKPLSEFGIKVYSGIRTGYAKAFYLEENQFEQFSHDVQQKWIKPIILPSNILRWTGTKKRHHLIFVPHNAERPPLEILNHLESHRSLLEKRNEVESSDEWYRLRSCSYYAIMQKRKIIFPDLSSKQRFSLCEENSLVADGAYFLDSDDPVLLGILNSEFANLYFSNRCSSVGNLKAQGRFRFKKTFIKDFPLPGCFSEATTIRSKIKKVVNDMLLNGETLENKKVLDQAVEEFYGEQI
jgi:hypothetical protein